MALDWFDANDAENFGKSLAQFFIKNIPLRSEGMANNALPKQFDTVDKMYLQIEQFKADHKLNIYKKSKLGSAFKFELAAAGYESAFVDQVTKGLVQKL